VHLNSRKYRDTKRL